MLTSGTCSANVYFICRLTFMNFTYSTSILRFQRIAKFGLFSQYQNLNKKIKTI